MAGNQTIIMHPNGLGGSQSWSPSAPAPGGEPTLSAISGSFVQGSAMALSGSGFSAQRNGLLSWDSFESYTVGQPAVGQLPAAYTDGGGAGGKTRYRIADNQSLFGSKSLLCDAPVGQQLVDGLQFIFPAGTQAALVSFWARVHTNVEGSAAQIKLTRLTGNRESHTQSHASGITWFSPQAGNGGQISCSRYINSSNTLASPTHYADTCPPVDQWFRVTQYVRLSTPGVADGQQLCVGSWQENWDASSLPAGNNYASPSGAHTPQSWKMDNVVTRDSGVTTSVDACLFGFYVRETCSYDINIDQIMINDSFESVWFGDAATWAACTPSKRVPQRVTSRSGAAINIEAQVGPLSTGPVYAYVFNADGQYNASGLLVRAA